MAYSVEIRREAVGILYDIRGAAESVARTVGALGLALPTAGNTFAQGGDLDVYWVGAQRWLLRSHGGRELVAELSALDRDPQVSVVDVTDAYAMFAITGAEANEIMAQATSLDVHWSVFPPIGRRSRNSLARRGSSRAATAASWSPSRRATPISSKRFLSVLAGSAEFAGGFRGGAVSSSSSRS